MASTLIDHIGRVNLRVSNIGAAVDFYRDIVGLHVLEQDGNRALLGAAEGPGFLALNSDGVDARAVRHATGLFHTAFRYPDRAALAEALARVIGAGLELGAGDHGVSEALYIDDPDGNGVELYRDRPVEEWPKPGPDERVRMYTEPVDLSGLLAESGRDGATSAAAPPGTGIGHVHLQVSDVGRTVSFYVDEVGLDLMARMGGQAAFFSSNGYHHHVGANSWNSSGRGPAPRNHAGLDQVDFSARDSSELERLEDRLSETGHALERRADGLITRDPDGVELRFSP
jgi:catechol 2,3-dioxygenase